MDREKVGGTLIVDAAAVAKARQGDKESFARVYSQVADDLYRVALYSLGNTHDAQDVVSETFLEAYKGLHNLRDENSFAPWIMRILSARCKRKIKQYISARNCFDIDDFLDLQEDVDSLDSRATERIQLLQEMEKLSPPERQVLALSVVQGYTVRETAQMLGEPQGTVSSRLHRTLKKLRGILQSEHV